MNRKTIFLFFPRKMFSFTIKGNELTKQKERNPRVKRRKRRQSAEIEDKEHLKLIDAKAIF